MKNSERFWLGLRARYAEQRDDIYNDEMSDVFTIWFHKLDVSKWIDLMVQLKIHTSFKMIKKSRLVQCKERDGRAKSLLPVLLLMSHLPQPLLPFVGRHFSTKTLLTTGHRDLSYVIMMDL